jgi:DNA-directed RNA polymerase subunit RPC12/RpoP
MDVFKFACPECGQHISGDEQYGGHQIQCPHCHRPILVPLGPAIVPPRPVPPPVRQIAQAATSSRWPAVLFYLVFILVVCLAAGWALHRRTAPRRRIEASIGRSVVVLPPEAPDVHALSASASSPIATIRVQNPPQAITFLLELKKPVEQFYEEGAKAWKEAKSIDEFSGKGTQLHYGVARICFDTDDDVKTGQPGPSDGPRGYELILNATLFALGDRVLAEWANAHVNLGKAKGHVLDCSLHRVQTQPGQNSVVNPRKSLERAKVDGKRMWITVPYSDLAVRPGQIVRITFMDQGTEFVYGDGEMLPSFPIKLQ